MKGFEEVVKKAKAKFPFEFYTRLNLKELTGKKASDLREFVKVIKEVPGSVIFHHTHLFLQQHQYLCPEPPNDFAYWVRETMQEVELAERLSSIDTCQYSSIRDLREKIVETIEDHLAEGKEPLRKAREGQGFQFIRTMSFVLPTPYTAYTLEEFVEILRKVSIHSIYFHFFESRLKLEKGINDFSNWIDKGLGEKELAREIAGLDPYTYTMEGLREKLIEIIKRHIWMKAKRKRKSGSKVIGL